MPAEAGIQSVINLNNFKNLDSRLRGNDGISPNCDTVSVGRGEALLNEIEIPSPSEGGGRYEKMKNSPLTLPSPARGEGNHIEIEKKFPPP
jgi:hypothetical protein